MHTLIFGVFMRLFENLFHKTLLVCCIVSSTPVLAHSGGLNSQGCHAGSRPYHCHRAQNPSPRSNNFGGGDKDCSDFDTWLDAQIFFERNGAHDPHRLDADNDGIACEHLR